MFKNFIIVILAISTGLFAWLAIRNSTPLECSDVITIRSENICIVNLKKLDQSQLKTVIQQIKDEQYKYINE